MCGMSFNNPAIISSFLAATEGMSILFNTTTCGFDANNGENNCNSLFIAEKSLKGSSLSPFTMCTIILHLSICLKNPLPSPTPCVMLIKYSRNYN